MGMDGDGWGDVGMDGSGRGDGFISNEAGIEGRK